MDWTRRGVLAGATVVGVSLAGCSTGDGSEGPAEDSPTSRATNAGPAESTTGTVTQRAGDDPVAGSATWRQPRATVGATGYNTADASPPTGRAFDGSLEDGFALPNFRAPIVGSDAVYAVSRAAEPYSTSPPQFAFYAHALSRDDGSQLWRRELFAAEGTENQGSVSDFAASLGPDALYTVRHDDRTDSYGATVTKVARDGSSAEQLATFERATRAVPPVVDDGTLFMFSDGGRLVALSAADGSVEYRSNPYSYWHLNGAPVVGSDAVAIVNAGGGQAADGNTDPEWSQVTVLDRADGTHRWTTEIGYARSIPTVVGETVYVVDGDRGRQSYLMETASGTETIPPRTVRALDVADGSERWSYQYEREATMNEYSDGGANTLTVDEDSVYLALGFADAPASTDDAERREELRAARYRGPNLFALDRHDGAVQWEATLGDSAKVFVPTVVDENHLYALHRPVQGRPRLYVIDKTDGTVVTTVSDGVYVNRWFAVADGEVYQTNGAVRSWQ